MSILKRNTNYIENGKNNMDFIREIVDKIMKEKINHSPCDYICRNTGSSYPKTNHKVLEIPGDFENLENAYGFKLNGHALYMDGVESVRLDNGKETRKYATCIEYITTDFDPKSERIFDYDLSIIIQLKKFCYNIVVTHRKQEEKEKTYFIDGHPVHVLFRVFDKEKIYEILNTLSKKDYTNNRMTDEDVVKFSYGIAFAKDDYAKDYLEKSAELFSTIEKINQAQRIDLFKALKEKIKYHFDDDIKKKEELITMIAQSMYPQDFEKLSRREQMEFRLKQLQDVVDDRDEELSLKNKELHQKDEMLSKNIEELHQKDEEIFQLKKELALFKNAT